jgi:hypothetical protein
MKTNSGAISLLEMMVGILILAVLGWVFIPEPQPDIESVDVSATASPSLFGGTPPPSISVEDAREIELVAVGSWDRVNYSPASGPAGDPSTLSGLGPLPGQAFNLLCGQWIGGASDGRLFAIGNGITIEVSVGATDLAFFFNDDINTYDDNNGIVTVVAILH